MGLLRMLLVDRLRDSFYRCRFTAVISSIDELGDSQDKRDLGLDFLKINCLYELGRGDEVPIVLEFLKTQMARSNSPRQRFYAGRILYLDGDHQIALAEFRESLCENSSGDDALRCQIAIANCHYSLRQTEEARQVLEAIPEDCELSIQLHRDLLCANIECEKPGKKSEARELLYSTMQTGLITGWNYFALDAIYGLAKLARSEHNVGELRTLIEFARGISQLGELSNRMKVFNDQFGSFLRLPLIFNVERLEIKAEGHERSVQMGRRPLVFKLLRALAGVEHPQSKHRIFDSVWGVCPYDPSKHDLKIYDLIKRTRQFIAEHFPAIELVSIDSGFSLNRKNGSQISNIEKVTDEGIRL